MKEWCKSRLWRKREASVRSSTMHGSFVTSHQCLCIWTFRHLFDLLFPLAIFFFHWGAWNSFWCDVLCRDDLTSLCTLGKWRWMIRKLCWMSFPPLPSDLAKLLIQNRSFEFSRANIKGYQTAVGRALSADIHCFCSITSTDVATVIECVISRRSLGVCRP